MAKKIISVGQHVGLVPFFFAITRLKVIYRRIFGSPDGAASPRDKPKIQGPSDVELFLKQTESESESESDENEINEPEVETFDSADTGKFESPRCGHHISRLLIFLNKSMLERFTSDKMMTNLARRDLLASAVG